MKTNNSWSKTIFFLVNIMPTEILISNLFQFTVTHFKSIWYSKEDWLVFFPLYKYTCMYMFVHTLTVVPTQGQKEHELTSFYILAQNRQYNVQNHTMRISFITGTIQMWLTTWYGRHIKARWVFFFAIIGDKFRLQYFKNQHPRSKHCITLWDFFCWGWQ